MPFLIRNQSNFEKVVVPILCSTSVMCFFTDFEELKGSETIDDYAKDGGPGAVWPWCSFYHDPLRY